MLSLVFDVRPNWVLMILEMKKKNEKIKCGTFEFECHHSSEKKHNNSKSIKILNI